jgi:hypothetical protein
VRSELVFAAKCTLPNRYVLCRVLSTATRKFHRPKTRVEDTTDEVLRRIAASEPGIVMRDEPTHVK